MAHNVEKQSFAICLVLCTDTTELKSKLVLQSHTLPAGGAIHNTLQTNGIWGGLDRMIMFFH